MGALREKKKAVFTFESSRPQARFEPWLGNYVRQVFIHRKEISPKTLSRHLSSQDQISFQNRDQVFEANATRSVSLFPLPPGCHPKKL